MFVAHYHCFLAGPMTLSLDNILVRLTWLIILFAARYHLFSACSMTWLPGIEVFRLTRLITLFAVRCHRFSGYPMTLVPDILILGSQDSYLCRPIPSFLGLLDVVAARYNNFQAYKTHHVVFLPLSSILGLQNSSRCLPPDIFVCWLVRWLCRPIL